MARRVVSCVMARVMRGVTPSMVDRVTLGMVRGVMATGVTRRLVG